MTSSPRNLRLKSVLSVPIYDCTVYLFISYDAEATYRRVCKAYNFPADDKEGFAGMTVSDDEGNFGMFFHLDLLTAQIVGHEVNHLTRMIMKRIGHKTCPQCDNDEVDSYLCGYLHGWVKRKLKAARIRVL